MSEACQLVESYFCTNPGAPFIPALIYAVWVTLLNSSIALFTIQLVFDSTKCHFPVSHTVFYLFTIPRTSLMMSDLPVNLATLS